MTASSRCIPEQRQKRLEDYLSNRYRRCAEASSASGLRAKVQHFQNGNGLSEPLTGR